MVNVGVVDEKPAIKRIRNLIGSASICMFSTSEFNWALQPQSVHAQDVDSNGNIYFIITDKDLLGIDFCSSPSVQLFYSNAAKSEFLSVFGWATNCKDLVVTSHLGNLVDKGEITPQSILLKVSVNEAFEWDNTSQDMIVLSLDEPSTIEQRLYA